MSSARYLSCMHPHSLYGWLKAWAGVLRGGAGRRQRHGQSIKIDGNHERECAADRYAVVAHAHQHGVVHMRAWDRARVIFKIPSRVCVRIMEIHASNPGEIMQKFI